jgi:hypothetical protein
MNNIAKPFRLATVAMAVLLAWFAAATIFAEALTPKSRLFSTMLFAQNPAASEPAASGALADWAAASAPLRGDLLADIAMARGASALNAQPPLSPGIIATRQRAVTAARQSLSFAPHASPMWLLLAMLGSQSEPRDAVTEDLKMSYLTSPADPNLIPARLAAVASTAAIADPELKDLARGDIRLILTRRPDLKPAIVSAFRGGGADGKAYIGDVVQSLDPGFAASLQ